MSKKVDFAEFQRMQGEKRKRLDEKSRKPTRSGGGGDNRSFEIPAWKHRQEYFKPSQEPTRIRIIPDEKGKLWYPYMNKWVATAKGKRNIISNSWNGDRAIPCVLDYYAIEDENPDLRATEQMVTTVVVLENHYKVPKTSKAGNEYFVYERSLGTDKHGRSLDPAELQKNEKVFGRKLHWSMWPTQQRNFMNTLHGLEDKCANCARGHREGEISVFAYDCPDCGKTIADHRTETLEHETEQTLRNQNVVCPHCDNSVLAAQQFECVAQETHGGSWVKGCDSPERISLDEPLDLVIRAVPAGRSVAIEVLEWGQANETAAALKVPEWMLKPFEFDTFFGKMDLQEQADAMGRDMPFEESAQVLVDRFFEAKPDEEDDDTIPF